MTDRPNTFLIDELETMPQVESIVDRLRPYQDEMNHQLWWGRGTDPMPNVTELNWAIRREEITVKEVLRRYSDILTDAQKKSLIIEEKIKRDAIKKCPISKKEFRDLGFHIGFDVWGGYAYLSEEQIIREVRARNHREDWEYSSTTLVEEIKVEHESRYVYGIDSRTVRDRLLNRTGYIKNAEELSRFLQGAEFPYDGPKISVNKGLYQQMKSGNKAKYTRESFSLNSIRDVFKSLLLEEERSNTRNTRVYTGRGGMQAINRAMKEEAETILSHHREHERINGYTMTDLRDMPLLSMRDSQESNPVVINAEEGRFSWTIPNSQ